MYESVPVSVSQSCTCVCASVCVCPLVCVRLCVYFYVFLSGRREGGGCEWVGGRLSVDVAG